MHHSRDGSSSQPTRHLAIAALALAIAAASSACEGSLTAPGGPSLVSVTVMGNTAPRVPGQTHQLTAAANLSDGSTQNVSGLATWESSNPAVATVTTTGLVTAVAPGQAHITAAYQGQAGTLPVMVAAPPPPPPSTGDAILLESITPPVGPLVRGSQVTFTAVVSYRLASAESARIPMVIQDQANNRLQSGSQAYASVVRGTGTATVSDQITVPAQGVTSVIVYLPLFPQGVQSTSTVVSVKYPVQ